MSEFSCLFVRTDEASKEFIWKEIQSGRLRMGWSLPGTSLLNNGTAYSEDEWIANYRNASQMIWQYEMPEEDARKRFRTLSPLIGLKKGAIVVVPKIPDFNSFLIARVADGYHFDENIEKEFRNDFCSFLSIAPESIKLFDYQSSEQTRIVKAKVRAYQKCVNNVWNETFLDAIHFLIDNDVESSSKDISSIFGEMREKLSRGLLERIRLFPPSDIENLFERAFTACGYELEGRNRYDREGGDSDIIMSLALPLISDLTDFSQKFFIQIKKKTGIDLGDIEGVNQLALIAKDEKMATKILISTADEFTPAAKQMAEDENVILIAGQQAVSLLSKYL